MSHKGQKYLYIVLSVLLCACSLHIPGYPRPSTIEVTSPFDPTPTPRNVGASGQKIGSGSTDSRQPNDSALAPEIAPYAAALQPAYQHDLQTFTKATRYDIDLVIERDLQHIHGSEQVRYVNRNSDDLQEILLRLYPNTTYLGGHMQVTGATVAGQAIKPVNYMRPTVGISGTAGQPVTDTSVISLALTSPLKPGQAATIAITFSITIPLHANGGYRTFGWANEMVSLPNAYPLVAIRDEKGWRVDASPTYGDIVFSEVSLYRVHIRSPFALVVVATGVCTNVTEQPSLPGQAVPTWRDTSCVAGPVRDFAIHASARYQQIDATVQVAAGNLLISSFYLPQSAHGGQRALAYATQAVRVYEHRFGPYPYRELKIFESPNTAGGIEYPMVVGVTDSLYNQDGGYFEWITAHEVAHQWWYGLVGSDPVNEAWMDESLTQYASSLYIEDRYGQSAADAEREKYFTSRYRQVLQAGRDVPVAQPTGAFDRNLYSPMVYGKGPLFFDAVRRSVGDQRFSAWLRLYFNRYRYAIAHASDLLAIADETGIGPIVRQAYDQWMLSAQKP